MPKARYQVSISVRLVLFDYVFIDFHVSTKSWHLSRKAYSSAVSFNLSNRPDCEKWPAPKSHLKSRMRLSVLFSLNLATNFAGSLHVDDETAENDNANLRLS